MATDRDFLYQDRLIGLRPFVADDGMPGVHFRFEHHGDVSAVMTAQTIEALRSALQQLAPLPPPSSA